MKSLKTLSDAEQLDEDKKKEAKFLIEQFRIAKSFIQKYLRDSGEEDNTTLIFTAFKEI
jgi:hypothetical protein